MTIPNNKLYMSFSILVHVTLNLHFLLLVDSKLQHVYDEEHPQKQNSPVTEKKSTCCFLILFNLAASIAAAAVIMRQ